MDPGLTGWLFYFLFLFSTPVYLMIITVMIRNRKKKPFCDSFFTISLSIGIFDMIHLIPGWLTGRFANFGWYGVHRVVLTWPSLWAKFESMVWWFGGLGQTLGVPLLAAARMFSVSYGMELSRTTVRALLVVHWTLPAVITLPQLWMKFDYVPAIANDSSATDIGDVGVLMVWLQPTHKDAYFTGCIWWCTAMAVISGCCFAITFHSVYVSRDQLRRTTNTDTSMAEIKLALVGVVLFVLTAFYAVYCGVTAGVTDFAEQMSLMEWMFIIGDVYSWINAYLLLLCSRTMRQYTLALIFCTTPDRFFAESATFVVPRNLASRLPPIRRQTLNEYGSNLRENAIGPLAMRLESISPGVNLNTLTV